MGHDFLNILYEIFPLHFYKSDFIIDSCDFLLDEVSVFVMVDNQETIL